MPSPTTRVIAFQWASWPILFFLAGCAGYVALVLCTASLQDAQALANNFPQHWPPLHAAPGTFVKLRWLLTGLMGVFGLLGVVVAKYFTPKTFGYSSWRSVILRVWHGLLRSWWALSPSQRRWALVGLCLITALRVVASLVGINVDDMASYMHFVRNSLLTVTAYYPAPNNHIASNTLSWAFYQVYPGYWWSMRAPVLLLSTVSTAGWFLALLYRTNFRIAALTITLFSFLETSLFAAALGRGYTLVTVFAGLGFFSLLLLSASASEGRTVTQRMWAGVGFVIAGVLGLFTVPTFAYFLVGAYSWLGIRWRHRPTYLVSLGLLGTATVLGASLLYSPLLLISGPASFFQNEFVKPLDFSLFLRQLPAYVWQTEGGLFGESSNGMLASWHVGSIVAVFVLGGFLLLVAAARNGHLTGPSATYILRTGVPALWMLLLPYALLLAQRVEAPWRTLGFKAVFMFLLAGIQVDWLLASRWFKAPYLRKGLLVGLGLWMGAEIGQLYRSNELRLSYHRTPHLVALWLLKQPSGPILVTGSPWYLTYLPFYFLFEDPTSAVVVDASPRAGVRYRYLIGPPAAVAIHSPGGQLRLHLPPDLNCEAIDVVSFW